MALNTFHSVSQFLPIGQNHRKTSGLPTMVGWSSGGMVPQWLLTLLGEKFFKPCSVHEFARKNERNIFCLDCSCSFCPQCISPHRPHRLLQIRRYVYQDVIRLNDLEKLIDCALVQSYITNNAKVVFINERPQTRPFRLSVHVCITCDRPLQDPYHFCSLSCKLKHLVGSEGGIGSYLYDCDFLPLCEMEDSTHLSSADSSSGGGCVGYVPEMVVRKKRSSFIGGSNPAAPALPTAPSSPTRGVRCSENVNRRKSQPSRSPLY
ncbi:PLATZ transcription factor family protein [Zostera marina]|uniref:PLATZ transcription factor family protein n=1 Tax=Zostera marina TaxID=29655 RepID=A0A0K9NPN8_ZOSMR|nr:PLATZ transcription factor family protein [Zostera marina]